MRRNVSDQGDFCGDLGRFVALTAPRERLVESMQQFTAPSFPPSLFYRQPEWRPSCGEMKFAVYE